MALWQRHGALAPAWDAGLRVNALPWAPPSWPSLVAASMALTLQLSLVLLSCLCFLLLHLDVVSAWLLIGPLALGAGAAAVSLSLDGLRGVAALLVLVYVLTPVLASLYAVGEGWQRCRCLTWPNSARPIADDTIWTASALLLALHVLLHDYTTPPPSAPAQLRSPSATSAALLSTLFLTSRLARHEQRFAFIALGLCLFALVPLGVARVQSSPLLSALGALSAVLSGGALWAFCAAYASHAVWCVWAFFAVVGVVSGVAPALMWHMLPLRHHLEGQWSEVFVEQ